jgi:hypothetical protein
LERVWGTVRAGDSDAVAKTAVEEHGQYKAVLTPVFFEQSEPVS